MIASQNLVINGPIQIPMVMEIIHLDHLQMNARLSQEPPVSIEMAVMTMMEMVGQIFLMIV